MTARSASSYLWLITKRSCSWSGSRATVHDLFDWLAESMTGRCVREFKDDKLTCVYNGFRDTMLGDFIDALRETPNLDKFPDMPPRMMYLTHKLTKRIDFHPDAIERAIEADHYVVRILIRSMGGHAYLDFVRERNIPLGPDSLCRLGRSRDLSREEREPFWREVVSIGNKLSWLWLPLQGLCMMYTFMEHMFVMCMVVAGFGLAIEFGMMIFASKEDKRQFAEESMRAFEFLGCQLWAFVAPFVSHWLSPPTSLCAN